MAHDPTQRDRTVVGKRYRGVPTLALPAPEPATMALDDALKQRLSCRHFAAEPLTLVELATLLGSAYGVGAQVAVRGLPGGELTERPLPSAGNRRPLELYLLIRAVDGVPAGVHHYHPAGHRLEQLRGPLPWATVVACFQHQPYVAPAAAILVVTAVLERVTPRYGPLRGARFALLEAGHLGQNLYLLAAAHRLGCLALGGIDEAALVAHLDLDPTAEPLAYALALGHPATPDRGRVRDL